MVEGVPGWRWHRPLERQRAQRRPVEMHKRSGATLTLTHFLQLACAPTVYTVAGSPQQLAAMLIPLSAAEGDAPPSWAMLEMQGELERKDGGTLEEAFDVGTLSLSSSVSAGGTPHAWCSHDLLSLCLAPFNSPNHHCIGQGVVLLTIGYHQLEGKRMELKKPFAVLDRAASSGGGSGEEAAAVEYKVRKLTSCDVTGSGLGVAQLQPCLPAQKRPLRCTPALGMLSPVLLSSDSLPRPCLPGRSLE